MNTIWTVLAWLFAVCGLAAYLSAWGTVWFGWNLWRASSDTLFLDAIATALFALFFLAWAKSAAPSSSLR